MKKTKPSSDEFTALAYMTLLSATIVATFVTKSVLVLVGGIVGTALVIKILTKH
jgi:hypothetical protein